MEFHYFIFLFQQFVDFHMPEDSTPDFPVAKEFVEQK